MGKKEITKKEDLPNIWLLLLSMILPPACLLAFFVIFQGINPEVIGIELKGFLNAGLSIFVIIVLGIFCVILFWMMIKVGIILIKKISYVTNNYRKQS